MDYKSAGTERDQHCVDAELCHVCGLDLGDDRWGMVTLSAIVAGRDNIDEATWTVGLLDNWSMHHACLKLACAHCPVLKQYIESKQAVPVRESVRVIRPDPRPDRRRQTITAVGGDVEEAALWFEQHHRFSMRAQPMWVKEREAKLGRSAQILDWHYSFQAQQPNT